MRKLDVTGLEIITRPTILRFGQGKPHIMTVGPLHGDEKTVIFLQREVIRLARSKESAGTMTVFALPNPMGSFLKMRNDPIQKRDPNRSFSQDGEAQNYVQRMVQRVKELSTDCDLVIDLHNYGANQILPQVVVFDFEDRKEVTRRSLRAGLKLDVPVVEVEKVDSSTGSGTVGTLSYALNLEGVASFIVELSAEYFLTSGQIIERAETIMGLFDVLESFANSVDSPVKFKTLQKVGQEKAPYGLFAFSPVEGLQVGQQIQRGTLLGTLLDLNDFVTEKKVVAPATGVIMELSNKRILNPGMTIVKIGEGVQIEV